MPRWTSHPCAIGCTFLLMLDELQTLITRIAGLFETSPAAPLTAAADVHLQGRPPADIRTAFALIERIRANLDVPGRAFGEGGPAEVVRG